MTKEQLQDLVFICDQAMEHSRQCVNRRKYCEGWTQGKPLTAEEVFAAGVDAYNEIQHVRMVLQEELWKSQ